MHYQTKLQQVEALRWDGSKEATTAIEIWSEGLIEPDEGDSGFLAIFSEDGLQLVNPGDWIVRYDDQTFYRLPESIFNRKYEPVPAEES